MLTAYMKAEELSQTLEYKLVWKRKSTNRSNSKFYAIHPVVLGTIYFVDLLRSKHNKVLLFLFPGLSHIS